MFEEEELDAGVAWQLSVDRSVRRRLGRNTGLTAGLFLVFQFFLLFFLLVFFLGVRRRLDLVIHPIFTTINYRTSLALTNSGTLVDISI